MAAKEQPSKAIMTIEVNDLKPIDRENAIELASDMVRLQRARFAGEVIRTRERVWAWTLGALGVDALNFAVNNPQDVFDHTLRDIGITSHYIACSTNFMDWAKWVHGSACESVSSFPRYAIDLASPLINYFIGLTNPYYGPGELAGGIIKVGLGVLGVGVSARAMLGWLRADRAYRQELFQTPNEQSIE